MGCNHHLAPRPHAPHHMDTFTPRQVRRRTVSGAAGLLAATILLTGCADSVRSTQSAPNVTESGTATVTPIAESTQSSAESKMDKVISAWEAATGESCLRQQRPNAFEHAEKAVFCDSDVIMSTFKDAGDQPEHYKEIIQRAGPESGSDTIVSGDKWSVLTEEGSAQSMSQTLGGKLLSVEDIEAGGTEPLVVSGIEDLTAAWEQATGETCAGAPESVGEFNELSAECSSNDSVAVYESAEQLEVQMGVFRSLFEEFDITTHYLVGDEWTVNAEPEILEEVRELIGGEIVSFN